MDRQFGIAEGVIPFEVKLTYLAVAGIALDVLRPGDVRQRAWQHAESDQERTAEQPEKRDGRQAASTRRRTIASRHSRGLAHN